MSKRKKINHNTDNTAIKEKLNYLSFNIRITVNIAITIFLIIISFLVYANTLRNGFVLDDKVAITNNVMVGKGFSAIPQILFTPYHLGYDLANTDNLYRPLSLVVFASVYEYFGTAPAVYHFINILLFAGCVVMLFRFIDKLFEQKKTAVALIASLLFALHPIHTEVVANVKSCDELLCFFFAFSCLNLFVSYMQTGALYQLIAGALYYMLSLFSKETSITFLVIIPLIFFFYRNENRKRAIFITASSIAMAMIYLLTRYMVLNYYHANNQDAIGITENILTDKALTTESRLATVVFILGYYVKLLFLPHPLICIYSYGNIPYVHFSNVMVILSLAIYIFMTVFSIYCLFKKRGNPYAFGILFFLITISLFSNIPFLLGAAMAERFVFFPSAGFCLVVALLIVKIFTKAADNEPLAVFKNPRLYGLLIPLLFIYGVITAKRNSDWIDEYTLYKADLAKAPDDSRLNYFVGDALILGLQFGTTKKDTVQKALTYLYRATAIYPEYNLAENDIGYAYILLTRYDSAETHLLHAYKINPRYILVDRNLGWLYFLTGKYQQSVEYNKKGLETIPANAKLLANVGIDFIYLGKYDSAIYYSEKAIVVDSGYVASYENLASAYKALGKTDSMQKYEGIAHIQDPDFKP